MEAGRKNIEAWVESRSTRETRARAASRRVLIIEDHRETAETLCELARQWGHEVAVAYTGPAGVLAAQKLQPDVVLCDLGLPGLDGYGVATTLRRGPAPIAARLVAISAYGMEEYRRRSLQAGFDTYLVKPIDLELLQRLLASSPALPRGPVSG